MASEPNASTPVNVEAQGAENPEALEVAAIAIPEQAALEGEIELMCQPCGGGEGDTLEAKCMGCQVSKAVKHMTVQVRATSKTKAKYRCCHCNASKAGAAGWY